MFFLMKVWAEIELVMRDTIPPCVKIILTGCGFSTLLSIDKIDDSKMIEIETFVNENRDIVEKLECCYADVYKSLHTFRFLPAHRLIILRLPIYIAAIFEANRAVAVKYNQQHSGTIKSTDTKYSFFLKKLIESAEENAGMPKNRYRYDKALQLFSIYIFLSCGRSCYEMLSSNLSIPSKHSVCEFHK